MKTKEINNKQLKSKQDEALTQNTNLFYAFLETIPARAIFLDKNGIIIGANKLASRHLRVLAANKLGINVKKYIGTYVYDLFPSKLARRRKKFLDFSIRTGKTIHFEDREDDRINYHSVHPLKNKNGEVEHTTIVVTDVTEQKKMRQDLKKSEEKYRNLVENTHVGICTLNTKGKFVYVNKSLYRMIGHHEKGILKKSFFDIFIPSTGSNIPDSLFGDLTNRMCSRNFEFKTTNSAGEEIDVEAHFTAIKISGKFKGFNAIITDISKRKRAEEKILVYQKDLRTLSSKLSLSEQRERHAIATEIHDNISYNLSVCQMKLAQLKTEEDNNSNKELTEIQAILKQLIQQTRSLVFEISSPLLYEIGLEAALDKLTEQIQEKSGIDCIFLDNGSYKPLNEDMRTLMFHMVRELLANAVRHAQASHIRVGIKRFGNELGIYVKDDGIGFDYSPKRYQNGDSQGFGLFSIRERLRYIGGRMEIKTKTGKGTQVILFAPLN